MGRLQTADLSSEDLKEREELLVSAMIIAQAECNNWSELLTLNAADRLAVVTAEWKNQSQCEQS
jgi:hypothetical protein